MNPHSHLFGRLHEEIRRADRILLIAHKKPDGDTLGASSSMLNWLRREGKNATAFCADIPAKTFHFIDRIHEYTSDPSIFHEQFDLVIVFDSGDLRYCGIDMHVPHLQPGYVLANIDHHATNAQYAHLNIVMTDASSTAEIMYRFFEEQNIALDANIATSLITGLLTDTSNFTNAATSAFAIEATSRLLSAGARFQDALKHIWQDKTIDALRVWGIMLSRLQLNETYGVVTTYLLERDVQNIPPELIEGMSNFLQAVTGETDVILVLRELPNNYIKGSIRSIRRDISGLAKLFGGGGHKKAAGFTVQGRIDTNGQEVRII